MISDQQRAARARLLLREAERLVEELVDGGAVELHPAMCDVQHAAESIDALSFDGGGKFVAAVRFEEDDGY